MNVDLGIWSKLTKIVVGLIVVAVLLLIGNYYRPVIEENARMQKENLRLQKELDAENVKSKELQAQIDALLHDSNTVERLVREKLGYARPGETVVRFEATMTNAPVR